MMGLTPRQMQLLRFIAGYQAAHGGVSPTMIECARGMGLKTKSAAHRLACGLEERGAVRWQAGVRRAIEVLVPVPVPSINGVPLYAVPFFGVRSVGFSRERL